MRVFLDANVLFSAAYRDSSPLKCLWNMPEVELVTSTYTLTEATRNLLRIRPDRTKPLEDLVSHLCIAAGMPTDPPEFPPHVMLPGKDLVVLAHAIQSRSDILLTGDAKHFGHLYGTQVGGVWVLKPCSFITGRWG